MSRRYLLVASSAASAGYLVGWLAGSNVQRAGMLLMKAHTA